MGDWVPLNDRLPDVGVVVETKIDDAGGVRNVQTLKRYQREPTTRSLWFVPDGSMYVYYTPTHWRPLHVYDINDGERHWYIAGSADDALSMLRGDGGDENRDATTREVSGDELLKVHQDEPTASVTRPAREWATVNGCIGRTCH
jgi:hypothetical protein